MDPAPVGFHLFANSKELVREVHYTGKQKLVPRLQKPIKFVGDYVGK